MSEYSDASKMRELMIVLCNELESDPNDDLKYYKYLDYQNQYRDIEDLDFDDQDQENVIFHVKNKITAFLLNIEKKPGDDMMEEYERLYASCNEHLDLLEKHRIARDFEDFFIDHIDYLSIRDRGYIQLTPVTSFETPSRSLPISIQELISDEENSSSDDIKYWTRFTSYEVKMSYLSKTIYGAFSLVVDNSIDALDSSSIEKLILNIEDNIKYEVVELRPTTSKILIYNFMMNHFGMVENEVFGYEIIPIKS